MRAPSTRAGLAAGAVAVALAATAAVTPGPTAAAPTAPVPAPAVTVTAAAEPAAVTVVSHATADGQPRVYLTRRGTKGYTPAVTGLLGHTPKGLNVWVDGRVKHRTTLASHTKATVAIWRGLGVKARYRGYGTPKVTEGVITVTEGKLGCQNGHVGIAYQSWKQLGDDKYYVDNGRVYICPSIFGYDPWQWSATIRHELGHAAGLGHFDGLYGGSTQVMRSQNSNNVATFQSGDLNGLRFYAANNEKVRSLIPPVATADADYTQDGIGFTGSATMTYYKDKAVKIVVTENDKVLATTRAAVKNGGRFSITVPMKTGSHTYCLTAVSPVNAAAKQDLACASFYR